MCLALAGALPGCKVAKGPASIDANAVVEVEDLDDFEQALNRYALLAPDSPARAKQRAELQGFLGAYVTRQIGGGEFEEAIQALRYGVGLYTPAELRNAKIVAPQMAGIAGEVYHVTARRGAETPSLLALAVRQRFGDERTRDRAVEQWQTLEDWVVRNGPFAQEPLLRHEELERALEDVAAAFPSPFVVRRLADLYLARYEAAKASRGQDAGSAARRRLEVTGYLLMRLYLRADDVEGARAALASVEVDMPVAKLAELVERLARQRD